MSYMNAFPGRRRICKVGADLVVEMHLAVLHQQHDGCGLQLFVERCDGKDAVKRDRNLEFEIGEPVSLSGNDASVAHHGYGKARDAAVLHFRLDVAVSFLGQVAGGLLRGRGRGCGSRSKKSNRRGQRQSPCFHRSLPTLES